MSGSVVAVMMAQKIASGGGASASDSFTGTGNLTGNWTVVVGSFNQTGGAVYGNTGAASSYAYWNAHADSGDQEAEVTMNPSASGQYIGPVVRGATAAFTCAAVDCDSSQLYLSIWTAGAQSVVSGFPITAPAAGTVIKLRAEGASTLRLYFNGVEQTGFGSPYTVSGMLSTGRKGIGAYSNGTTTGAADWACLDL
jgi:hypothetical protein